jgi:hypothetical protein
MLYSFFWEIPWRLNFTCRHFGTHCFFHLHRWITTLMKMEQCVPKRRHINFRRLVTTQKKKYSVVTFFKAQISFCSNEREGRRRTLLGDNIGGRGALRGSFGGPSGSIVSQFGFQLDSVSYTCVVSHMRKKLGHARISYCAGPSET